jgi:acetylornithine/succinyldiaminopimelate/putrescine aminotransferase
LPYKDKERRKQYAKTYGASWYQRNRERTLKRTSDRKKQKRKEWHDFKAGLSCLFCGIQHPAVIDFHHPDATGDTKVSHYAQRGQWTRAYKEAEKCQPLCANCHRILHYNEREGEKYE